MVRLNRIYTKAGDGGDTRLVGGQKVAQGFAAHRGLRHRRRAVGRASASRARRWRRPARPPAPRRWPRSSGACRTSSSTWAAIWPRCPTIAAPISRSSRSGTSTALEQEIDGWNEHAPRAAQLRPPGRRLGRRLPAPGAHRLPPRRASHRPSGRRRADRRRRHPLRQSPVGRALRDEPPRRAPVRRARAALATGKDVASPARVAPVRRRILSTWQS